MNVIKKSIAGLSVVALTVIAGCKSDYLDINSNPNQVTAATPELVLPSALASTGAYMNTSFYFLNLWMGYWNWSGNYSISLSDKNYQFTNSFNQGIWTNGYLNLKNYNYLDQQGAALNQPINQAFGKIMKAFHFQILVDTYGDIPYTQALQGTTAITPTYDKAQAIYDDLIVQIDAALALLAKSEGTPNPGTNDIMFGGDIGKWRRFANTLKLRILLRQADKADRASAVQAGLATIKASGFGFLGAGENAQVNPGYANSQNQQSPLFGAFYQVNGQPTGTNNQYKGNGYAISVLKQTNDPRLAAYYRPVGGTGTNFNGTLFGTQDVQVNTLVSDVGPAVVKTVSSAAVIMSSHESLFLQAEAAQRGYITGNAKTLFQAAVTESFVNAGRTAAEATTYLAQKGVKNVDFDASTNKIETIITQKWVSENGVAPFEAWADYRRTGYPTDVPISQDPSVTVRQIPVRLFYPQTEFSTNATNVNAQGTVSQFTSKIFWVK